MLSGTTFRSSQVSEIRWISTSPHPAQTAHYDDDCALAVNAVNLRGVLGEIQADDTQHRVWVSR
jgi:hypothetical protein